MSCCKCRVTGHERLKIRGRRKKKAGDRDKRILQERKNEGTQLIRGRGDKNEENEKMKTRRQEDEQDEKDEDKEVEKTWRRGQG